MTAERRRRTISSNRQPRPPARFASLWGRSVVDYSTTTRVPTLTRL
jgi:hypothetical protein